MQCHEVTVKALVIMQPVKYFQWVFLQEKDPDADDLSSKEDEHENESDMASCYYHISHMGKQKYTAACVTQCQVWPPCPCWLHSRAQHQARGAAEWQSCHGVQLLKPTIITTLDNLVLWCFNVCSFVYCHSQLIPSPYSMYYSNILCNILIKHEKIHVMIYLKHNFTTREILI